MAPDEDFNPSYLIPGTRIGAYVVRGQLGNGSHGSGSVAYLVESPSGRQAVLKMSLSPRKGNGTPDGTAMYERFLRQVDALYQLRRVAGVAEILGQDYYPDPHGFPYFVQEWAGKTTLLDWVSSPQPLKKVILGWTLLAATCGEMGRRHICHRNLVPGTILMTPQGLPKMVDFSSALGPGALPLTPVGAEYASGQRDTYYSPERCLAILRERATGKPELYEYGPSDDLHALGAIFYQVLTGESPFDEPDDSDESLQRIAHAPPLLPSKRNAGVPWGLEKVTARLLQKSPAQRYQSGFEVAEELDAFLTNIREDWNRPFQMPRADRLSLVPALVPVNEKESEGPMPDTPHSKTPRVDSGAPAEAKMPREAAPSSQPAVLPDEADTAPPRGLWADAALDSDSDGDFDIPRVLDGGPAGTYTVERRLGRGGMGEVYLARQTGAKGFSQLVAIKRLRPGGRPWEERSFADEARILSRLHHENIAGIHAFFEVGGHPYLVMEYVEGESLYTLTETARRNGRRFSESGACAVMAGVAEGLDYAHHATDEDGRPLQVVHRDVSTTNILISKTGRVVLLDFGVALFEDEARAATPAGFTTIKGKAPYLSPEQVMRLPLDARSDLFSVGTILVELLTGEAPFGWTADLATLKRITTVTPEYVASLLPHVSEPLRAVCQRLLAAHPDQRFASARDAAVALRKCAGLDAGPEGIQAQVERLRALPDTKAAPPPAAEAAARALSGVQRARRTVTLASALTLAAALALVFWYVPRPAPPDPSSAPAQGPAVSLRPPEEAIVPATAVPPAPQPLVCKPNKGDGPSRRRRVAVTPPSNRAPGERAAPAVVLADRKTPRTETPPPAEGRTDGAVLHVARDSDEATGTHSKEAALIRVPPTVTAPPAEGRADGAEHASVSEVTEDAYRAVRAALDDALKRERTLREENVRLQADHRSVDHTLAAILMNHDVTKMAFTSFRKERLRDGGLDVEVELLAAHGKVATAITLTNGRGNSPWRFGEARVSRDLTSLTILPCSFTTDRDEIGPGETGKIVVVVDAKAFASSQGLVDLAVQIFRDDGVEELLVNLDHALVQR